ncbi:hypothetical protein J6590_017735 [Homalodisca vitripennis]|nr:hypothetical protein J6590_017735 [Homalodisca vitripennis]
MYPVCDAAQRAKTGRKHLVSVMSPPERHQCGRRRGLMGRETTGEQTELRGNLLQCALPWGSLACVTVYPRQSTIAAILGTSGFGAQAFSVPYYF